MARIDAALRGALPSGAVNSTETALAEPRGPLMGSGVMAQDSGHGDPSGAAKGRSADDSTAGVVGAAVEGAASVETARIMSSNRRRAGKGL